MSLLQRKLSETSDVSPEAAGPAIAPDQRVRVGLTGLAAIFLLVLIAAAGLRPTVPRAAPQPADEPLAVLGVAPTAPDDRTQTAARAQ